LKRSWKVSGRCITAALEERSQAWNKSHWSVTRIDQSKSLTTIRAFDPQGYGALPVNLSRWSLKKVDEASLLPSHQGQARQGRLPALQIKASVAGSASANFPGSD
jgi:hypothetical protein